MADNLRTGVDEKRANEAHEDMVREYEKVFGESSYKEPDETEAAIERNNKQAAQKCTLSERGNARRFSDGDPEEVFDAQAEVIDKVA